METGGHPVNQHNTHIRNNEVIYSLSDESIDHGSDDGSPDKNNHRGGQTTQLYNHRIGQIRDENSRSNEWNQNTVQERHSG